MPIEKKDWWVGWVRKEKPSLRGFLVDNYTQDDAAGVVDLRNTMFPHDYHFVVRRPTYKRRCAQKSDRSM